jgi:hypothetical protein
MTDLYPVTIVKDRYGGSYSRGKWLAYNLDEDIVAKLDPLPHGDDDVSMNNFWGDYYEINPVFLIGIGNTPDEALRDLKIKNGDK